MIFDLVPDRKIKQVGLNNTTAYLSPGILAYNCLLRFQCHTNVLGAQWCSFKQSNSENAPGDTEKNSAKVLLPACKRKRLILLHYFHRNLWFNL